MGVLLFEGGVGVGMLKWQTSGFPSRSGGNLKEGGNCKLCPCDLACSYQGLQSRLQPPRTRLEPRAPNQ